MNKKMAMRKWSQQPLPITRGQPLWIKGSWWKVWTINLGKKGATSQGRCECAFSKKPPMQGKWRSFAEKTTKQVEECK